LIREAGHYELLGRTRDDAAGEAYDKVAKLLGLGYPGGPAIDRLARQGNDRAYAFRVPRMTHADRVRPDLTAPAGLLPPDAARNVDFSFSGLKTAVLRVVSESGIRDQGTRIGRTGIEGTGIGGTGIGDRTADIAASFQRVVVEALLDRTFEIAGWLGAKSIGIAGGVSANSRLRAEAGGARAGIPVFIPPISLSTDNAAMIGAAGLRRLRMGVTAAWDLNALASVAID
jgi:N6-L-threonylcarbamoyladenine synthase